MERRRNNSRQFKFNKKFLGGVDEFDVLKKISEINKSYQEELKNEVLKYEAIINRKDEEIEFLRRQKGQF